VVHDRPEANEPPQSGQVLRFRPRRRPDQSWPLRVVPKPDETAGEPADDLAHYEQEDRDIDYGRRMLMNVIAVVIVAILVGLGVWIADSIADMQKAQDCAMQGRQNCAPIEVPKS
jgi:hypothetical protein